MTTGRINQVALRRDASSCASTLAFPHLTQKVPEYRSSVVATSNTFLRSGATRTPVDDEMRSTSGRMPLRQHRYRFTIKGARNRGSSHLVSRTTPFALQRNDRCPGLAGDVWGLLNSPHVLAVQFHQYNFFFLLLTNTAPAWALPLFPSELQN